MREANPVVELVIPMFPLLEEKGDKEKNKEEFESSQPALEEILEAELHDPLFSLNSREQSEHETMKYGMPQLIGESSGKGEPPRQTSLLLISHYHWPLKEGKSNGGSLMQERRLTWATIVARSGNFLIPRLIIQPISNSEISWLS